MGKAIFYTSPEPKLLNQSIPNFERMITSVKQRELPNLVVIGSTGAAPHVREVYSYILGFFCDFFLLLLLLLLVSSTHLQTAIRNGF